MIEDGPLPELEEDGGVSWINGQCENQPLPIIMYLCLLLLDGGDWRSYFPTLEEMPEGWPGQESEDGLREEHLSDCKWESSSLT